MTDLKDAQSRLKDLERRGVLTIAPPPLEIYAPEHYIFAPHTTPWALHSEPQPTTHPESTHDQLILTILGRRLGWRVPRTEGWGQPFSHTPSLIPRVAATLKLGGPVHWTTEWLAQATSLLSLIETNDPHAAPYVSTSFIERTSVFL